MLLSKNWLYISDFDNYYAHGGDESLKITDAMMFFHRVQQRRQLTLQIMLFLCILYTFFSISLLLLLFLFVVVVVVVVTSITFMQGIYNYIPRINLMDHKT
jgi:hypothetical protein